MVVGNSDDRGGPVSLTTAKTLAPAGGNSWQGSRCLCSLIMSVPDIGGDPRLCHQLIATQDLSLHGSHLTKRAKHEDNDQQSQNANNDDVVEVMH